MTTESHATVYRRPRTGRLALVAHYDRGGALDPALPALCRGLADIGCDIVVISTSPLPAAQAEAAIGAPLAALLTRPNHGFDFAGWSSALGFCQSRDWPLGDVVLTNNSVVGPLWPLGPLVAQMSDAPVWGMVESEQIRPHLQSWWMYFSGAITRTQRFRRYWSSITPLHLKSDVIMTYELTWAQHFGAVPYAAGVGGPDDNPMLAHWREMITQRRVPFLKKRLFADEEPRFDHSGWRQLLREQAPDFDPRLVAGLLPDQPR